MAKKTKTKKSSKPRLYGVNYFDSAEMQGTKVLIHIAVVPANTSVEACQLTMCTEGRTVIRAYRFHKNTDKSQEGKLVSLKSLFSKKRVAEIMEGVAKTPVSPKFDDALVPSHSAAPLPDPPLPVASHPLNQPMYPPPLSATPLPDTSPKPSIASDASEDDYEHFPKWLIWVGGIFTVILIVYMANC